MSAFVEDIRVDAQSLVGGIDRWIALKRISLRDGLRKQAGLLADELVKDTPPDKGTGAGGKGIAARRMGEQRVAREITRAVRPLIPSQIQDNGLARLVREKRYTDLQKVVSHFSGEQVVQFSPSVHESARDVDGRVVKSKNQATPDWREHAQYIKAKQKNVGIAKGGWVASQVAMGRRPQAWLLRHAWAGACQDNTDALAGEQNVKLQNNSDWGGGRLAGILMRKAMTRREGRLARDIAGMLAAASRKAGLS